MTTIAVQTSRFGTIEIDQTDVVTFPVGLVGFPDMKQFVLIRHSDTSPYRWLQSLDQGHIAFLMVDPGEIVQDYAPEMPFWAVSLLGLQTETPRLVYTIVTIPCGCPQEMTVNLAGPVVINGASGQAVQIVLEDDSFPIKRRVFPEASEPAA